MINFRELDFSGYKQIDNEVIDKLYTEARIPATMPFQRLGYLLRGDFGLTDMELEVVGEIFDNCGGFYGLRCLENLVALCISNNIRFVDSSG